MPRSTHPRVKHERGETPDLYSPPPPYADTPPPSNMTQQCTCKHQCQVHYPYRLDEKPQQCPPEASFAHPHNQQPATTRPQRKSNARASTQTPLEAPQRGTGAPRERRKVQPRPSGKTSNTPAPRVEKTRPKPRINKHALQDTHEIRRILGERGTRGNKEYLVDWVPAWEDAEYVQNAQDQLNDWDQSKEERRTFVFDDAEVIRCTNVTEDDAPDQYEPFVNNVFAKFKEFMTRNPKVVATDLFTDNAWAFDDGHERMALRLNDRRPISPAEMMRRSYIDMRRAAKDRFREDSDSDDCDISENDGDKAFRTKHLLKSLRFADIKVCYLGQIDQELDRTHVQPHSRPAYKVAKFLEPLFSHHLEDLSPVFKECVEEDDSDTYPSSARSQPPFGLSQVHPRLEPLSAVVSAFATRAPYLLRHVWPLMFTRLFFFSDDIRERAAAEGIEIGEEWCDASRDWMLYWYKQEMEEGRAIDHVERTYLKARDEVMEHVERQYGDDGEVMEE